MGESPARASLIAALRYWRRHAIPLAIGAITTGSAAIIAVAMARYAAYLVAFTIWMGWVELTASDWIRRADFLPPITYPDQILSRSPSATGARLFTRQERSERAAQAKG